MKSGILLSSTAPNDKCGPHNMSSNVKNGNGLSNTDFYVYMFAVESDSDLPVLGKACDFDATGHGEPKIAYLNVNVNMIDFDLSEEDLHMEFMRGMFHALGFDRELIPVW
jgi:hypothetical protein